MSARKMTVEHDGTTYYGHVAVIESTHLGAEDHGIFTASLHVRGDGWGVSVGGFALDRPVRDEAGKFLRREGTAYGLDYLMTVMQTVGVDRWEQLPGRQVIVLYESEHPWGTTAVGIAHITDERKVLIMREHAAAWLARTDGGEE